MAQMNFTDRSILALKPPDSGQVDYFDEKTPGFGVRVSQKGTKSFFLKYIVNGRQRRMTFGVYPGCKLAEARKAAHNAKHEVRQGNDPSAARQEQRTAPTLKELADEYLDHHARDNKRERSWREDERMINAYLRDLYDQKAGDITRGQIKSLLRDIKVRGAPVQANRVLALVRKMYNFGLDEEIVEANPAARIKPSPEVERDRIYSPDEIRALWGAFTGQTGSIFKLCLITGQRRGEIAGMRWGEIDFESAEWTVPGERMKSKKVHLVPLSDMALDVLADVSRIDEELVFPSPVRRNQPIRNLQSPAEDVKKASGVEDFRSHDLRRTCGTNITGMGFPRFIMDRVLGHVEPGVGRRYDRHDYLREKKAALDAWGGKLRRIITGKKAAEYAVALRREKAVPPPENVVRLKAKA